MYFYANIRCFELFHGSWEPWKLTSRIPSLKSEGPEAWDGWCHVSISPMGLVSHDLTQVFYRSIKMITPRCLGQALTLVCHFDSLLSPPFFLSIPQLPICFSDRVSLYLQAGLGLAMQVQSRLKFVTPSKPLEFYAYRSIQLSALLFLSSC